MKMKGAPDAEAKAGSAIPHSGAAPEWNIGGAAGKRRKISCRRAGIQEILKVRGLIRWGKPSPPSGPQGIFRPSRGSGGVARFPGVREYASPPATAFRPFGPVRPEAYRSIKNP